MKYVPEKADLDDNLLEDFKKVLEKFSFNEPDGDEVAYYSMLLLWLAILLFMASLFIANQIRLMKRRMRQIKMLQLRRKPTQTQMRKNRITSRRRGGFLIRKRRSGILRRTFCCFLQ